MKELDTNAIRKVLLEKFDKQAERVTTEREQFDAELNRLKSDLAKAESKLDNSKNDFDAYKKQFHIVSNLRVDIEAMETLKENLNTHMNDLRSLGAKEFSGNRSNAAAIMQPYLEEFNKKKKELFEIYIQLIKGEFAIKGIREELISKYNIDFNALPFDNVINFKFNPFQFFADEIEEAAGHNPDRVMNFRMYGKFDI